MGTATTGSSCLCPSFDAVQPEAELPEMDLSAFSAESDDSVQDRHEHARSVIIH